MNTVFGRPDGAILSHGSASLCAGSFSFYSVLSMFACNLCWWDMMQPYKSELASSSPNFDRSNPNPRLLHVTYPGPAAARHSFHVALPPNSVAPTPRKCCGAEGPEVQRISGSLAWPTQTEKKWKNIWCTKKSRQHVSNTKYQLLSNYSISLKYLSNINKSQGRALSHTQNGSAAPSVLCRHSQPLCTR